MKSSPRSLQLEKARVQQRRPNVATHTKKNYSETNNVDDAYSETNSKR